MQIASAIVKVEPERAEDVLELLARIPKVTTYGIHKQSNIIIVAEAHDIEARVIPATDDRMRTVIETMDGELLDFQDYFVRRRHEDRVSALHYEGAADALPAPGVVDALTNAHTVVVAPSNPPLSIWPILAIDGIRTAVAAAPAVQPLSGCQCSDASPARAGSGLSSPFASTSKATGSP